MENFELKFNVINDECTLNKTSAQDNLTELSNVLIQKEAEIEKLQKQLMKAERLLEKSNKYNEDLRKELTELSSQIHDCRKIKSVVVSNNTSDAYTQVTETQIEEAYGNKPMPEWGDNSSHNKTSLSIAETVKATIEAELESLANAEINNAGSTSNQEANNPEEYIYDSTSGLYYHPATGYYWDSNQSLFYDYTSGTYYQYDEQTGQYNVHSMIDAVTQPQDTLVGSNSKMLQCLNRQGETSDVDTLSSRFMSMKIDARLCKKNALDVQNFVGKNQMKKKIKTRRRRKCSKKSGHANSFDAHADDIVMISDSEEEKLPLKTLKNRDNIAHVNKIENPVVPMEEVDDSSGSLATGESELESGEITDDSYSSEETVAIHLQNLDVPLDPLSEIAGNYPPCIRVIVESSEHLTVGSLYIITCAGGTIGREKNMGHTLEISDNNVSKLHAEVIYDYENCCYTLLDKGSQNGTILNGIRMSVSKEVSESHKLGHGDLIEIGSTCLLLHIHKGHDTCEECEPGLIQAKLKAQNPVKNDYVLLSKEEKDRQRKKELKNIKKKYGLQNSHYENPGAVLPGSDYTDKAHLRRKYIGSEGNVHKQDDVPASVQSPISSQNKGHKLLAKMGWVEGQGLGKSSSGIAEPITVDMRVNQSAGLGSTADVSVSLDSVHNLAKTKRWAQAQQRFHKSDVSLTQSVIDPPLAYLSPTSGTQDHAPSSTECPISGSGDFPGQLQCPKTLPKITQMSFVHGGTEQIGQLEPASLQHEDKDSFSPGSCKSQT